MKIEIELINNKILISSTFDEFFCKLSDEKINFLGNYLYSYSIMEFAELYQDEDRPMRRFTDKRFLQSIQRMVCCDYVSAYLKEMIDNPATSCEDFRRVCSVYSSGVFHK